MKNRRFSAKLEQELTHNKRVAAIKNMYFNRYLLCRYSLALFFFTNFYLAILTPDTLVGIGAIVLTVLGGISAIEMAMQYSRKDHYCISLVVFFVSQTLFNAALSAALLAMPAGTVLPFLKSTSEATIFGLVLSLSGLTLSAFCLYRLYQIYNKSDKQMQRIQFFEKKYNMKIT